MRLSEYRIMWIFVLYDLPTDTKRERKIASDFRKNMIKDGFSMFQFSIYLRHCPSKENAAVHIKRVQNHLPECGTICIFTITDKQFGAIEIYHGKKSTAVPPITQQLSLF